MTEQSSQEGFAEIGRFITAVHDAHVEVGKAFLKAMGAIPVPKQDDYTLCPDPLPQSDGAGALPTSPSLEVGVATSTPASSPEELIEFGSVVLAGIDGLSDRVLWCKSASAYWFSEESRRAQWIDFHEPEVLRIGVGAEKANLDEAIAYSSGYDKGADDMASMIRARIRSLRAVAITAPEQAQLDKAIRECR